MVLGDFPTWSAPQARKRAAERRRLAHAGRDPLGERQAPTFGMLRDDYLDHARATKRSWCSDRRIASSIFGFAVEAELIGDNPCRGIKRNP